MKSRQVIVSLAVPLLILSMHTPAAIGNPHRGHNNFGIRPELAALLQHPLPHHPRPLGGASLPVIRVTTTSDDGPGSLRQAILDANNHVGADSIAFNLSKSDPGYNALKGVWTIKPLSQLPLITDDGTIIEGASQALYSPGSNPDGPAVELEGSLAGPQACGLTIICSWTWVHALAINRFSEMGIIIAGPGHSFNLIYECYIGVTPDGKSKAGNLRSGVQILDAPLNFVSWPDTNFANIIGGNGESGIEIVGTGSTLNYIGPNSIGTDRLHSANLGNNGDGVTIKGGAADNAITGFDFPSHVIIWYNAKAGIRDSGSTTVRNLLAAGSVARNGGRGILLEDGGNGGISYPIIAEAMDDHISASAYPTHLVLFYRDHEDEGEEYLGQAYADAKGMATYTGPVRGPYITAVQVDTNSGPTKNNTSEFSYPYLFITYIEVTNTQDSGPGSLREALDLANTHQGADSIKFAIPTSDPGYNAALGTWTIKPLTQLPPIFDRQTVISGSSQNEFIGHDANTLGPEIELDGSLLGDATGIYLSSYATMSCVEGLVINRFNRAGIFVKATDSALICACYIGTDARGLQSAPNGDGVILYDHARHIYIGPDQALRGNLISGNTGTGIWNWDTCSTNRFVGNTIGLDQTRTKKLGNGGDGILIDNWSTAVEVSDNWIGGNYRGVELRDNSHSAAIMENMIGTDTSSRLDLGNVLQGIYISGSQESLISTNRIAFNGAQGVFIDGASALYNTISRNWISHHIAPGIANYNGGNASYPCPTITSLTAGVLDGQAQAYDHVEVFSDSTDEGQFYVGSANADATGKWALAQMAMPHARFLTTTATDAKGNTSCFSAPFDYVAADVPIIQESTPKTFELSQNYPNPFNPKTVLSSQLPVASNVKLVIYDLLGREVAVLVDGRRVPGQYQDTFDGSGLASGVYYYRLIAGNFMQTRKMVLAK